MSYTVTKTDGSLFAVVPDGTLNTDSSMYIVGKNYAGYGEFISENFIHLLENSADDISPEEPLTGQLWFDTNSSSLKVYNGAVFRNLGSIVASNDEPSNPVIGDLWYDSFNKQLFVYTGDEFLLIGPAFTPGLGVSGAIVDVIVDILGISHTVIKFFTDDEIVGIVSNDQEFVPEISIAGFNVIMPGFQLRAVGSDPNNPGQPKFEGTARSAFNLADLTGTYYSVDDIVLKDGSEMTGPLILSGDPIDLDQAATKRYVDNNSGGGGGGSDPTKVLKTGDIMTGLLTLSGDPTLNLHAATKRYVDNKGDEHVEISGSTMTGPLILNAIPTANLQAATKQYVDIVAGGGTGSGNVPPGGSTGQQLAKKSNLNYDTEWVDAGSGGGGEIEDPTKVPLDGSNAMTGLLSLSGDPVNNLQAATKQYADSQTNSMQASLNSLRSARGSDTDNRMSYNTTVSTINTTLYASTDYRHFYTWAGHHTANSVNFKPSFNCQATSLLSIELYSRGGIIDDILTPLRLGFTFQYWITGGSHSKSSTLQRATVLLDFGQQTPTSNHFYNLLLFDNTTAENIEFLKNTNYTINFEYWLSITPEAGSIWNGDYPEEVDTIVGFLTTALDPDSTYSVISV